MRLNPFIRICASMPGAPKRRWAWPAFCGHSAWGHAAWVELDPVYQAGLKFELHDPLTSEVKELKPVYSHPHQVVRWARGRDPGGGAGQSGHGWFLRAFRLGACRLGGPEAGRKTVHVQSQSGRLWTPQAESRLAKPALIPMDHGVHRKPLTGNLWAWPVSAGHSAWGHTAWVNLKPEENLYKSVRLFDPVRARNLGGGVGGKQFWGHGRWGSPPAHTAHAHVEVIYKINGASAWGQRAWSQLHAWTENDAETPIKQVCHVVRLNMRASDRIKLITQNHRPLRCGPGIKCGRHKCGQYVRETI